MLSCLYNNVSHDIHLPCFIFSECLRVLSCIWYETRRGGRVGNFKILKSFHYLDCKLKQQIFSLCGGFTELYLSVIDI